MLSVGGSDGGGRATRKGKQGDPIEEVMV